MKIYFVRHGQTVSNKKGTVTGHIDSPLNEKGIEQARQASMEIPSNFKIIYSSDLIRCKQTTEIINQKLHLPVKYDSRLRERNFGSLSGKTWEEIGSDLKDLDTNQKYDYRPYGGESVEDLKKRLFDFIEEISHTKKSGEVLVVAHGGIIRLLHKLKSGEAHEVIHNSSIHEFEF